MSYIVRTIAGATFRDVFPGLTEGAGIVWFGPAGAVRPFDMYSAAAANAFMRVLDFKLQGTALKQYWCRTDRIVLEEIIIGLRIEKKVCGDGTRHSGILFDSEPQGWEDDAARQYGLSDVEEALGELTGYTGPVRLIVQAPLQPFAKVD